MKARFGSSRLVGKPNRTTQAIAPPYLYVLFTDVLSVSLLFLDEQLSQEKSELREEKAALKSDIDNLNVQYQQRLRVMFPWTGMDPSVVMGPPTYSFPMPVPVPPGPIPMHPSLQPFPFFSSPNPGALPNPCSTFLPYSSLGNPQMEPPSTHYMPPHSLPTSRSQSASKQDSRSKSSDRQRGSNVEKSIDSNDVATELELKTPGSSLTTHLKSVPDQVR